MNADDPRSVHLLISSRTHAAKHPPRGMPVRLLIGIGLVAILSLALWLVARFWLG